MLSVEGPLEVLEGLSPGSFRLDKSGLFRMSCRKSGRSARPLSKEWLAGETQLADTGLTEHKGLFLPVSPLVNCSVLEDSTVLLDVGLGVPPATPVARSPLPRTLRRAAAKVGSTPREGFGEEWSSAVRGASVRRDWRRSCLAEGGI